MESEHRLHTTLSSKARLALGRMTGIGVTASETGRSAAEERMIGKFEKYGGKVFNVARSAETPRKNYKRPASD